MMSMPVSSAHGLEGTRLAAAGEAAPPGETAAPDFTAVLQLAMAPHEAAVATTSPAPGEPVPAPSSEDAPAGRTEEGEDADLPPVPLDVPPPLAGAPAAPLSPAPLQAMAAVEAGQALAGREGEPPAVALGTGRPAAVVEPPGRERDAVKTHAGRPPVRAESHPVAAPAAAPEADVGPPAPAEPVRQPGTGGAAAREGAAAPSPATLSAAVRAAGADGPPAHDDGMPAPPPSGEILRASGTGQGASEGAAGPPTAPQASSASGVPTPPPGRHGEARIPGQRDGAATEPGMPGRMTEGRPGLNGAPAAPLPTEAPGWSRPPAGSAGEPNAPAATGSVPSSPPDRPSALAGSRRIADGSGPTLPEDPHRPAVTVFGRPADPPSAPGPAAAVRTPLTPLGMDRVADAARASLTHGGMEIRLRLHPEHLGEVRVAVRWEGGVLSARLEAATPMARDALQDGVRFLRTSLQEQGIPLERVSIGLGLDLQPGSRDQHPETNAGWPTEPRPILADTDEPQRRGVPLAEGRLDIRI